jgi:2-oxoglutarate ferredoxin oxidoreductase subunit gamma
MGEVRVANVIMLGAYVRASGVIGEEGCRRALREVMARRKADLLALNEQALARGIALAGAAQ